MQAAIVRMLLKQLLGLPGLKSVIFAQLRDLAKKSGSKWDDAAVEAAELLYDKFVPDLIKAL